MNQLVLNHKPVTGKISKIYYST